MKKTYISPIVELETLEAEEQLLAISTLGGDADNGTDPDNNLGKEEWAEWDESIWQ